MTGGPGREGGGGGVGWGGVEYVQSQHLGDRGWRVGEFEQPYREVLTQSKAKQNKKSYG